MRLLIFLAVFCATSAVPRQSTRIVGGESTAIERYPFMASMLFILVTEGRLLMGCGGTLVTKTSVVSAAHCFYGVPRFLLRVRLGSTLYSSGGNMHSASKIILHEQFDSYLAINDVAIVKLRNPAVFSNQINIARIAGPRYFLSDNTLVHAIGWGDTEYDGSPSEVLQHVAVRVINHKICTERYEYLKSLPNTTHIPNVTPEMLCTGILDVGGKDACQGDSGGPIIHNGDVLVGITSWGYECAHKTYPGINVRVSSYTNWIYTNSLNE